jgi:predicted Zn-dependent protease with MMP-like domain
MSDKPSLFAAPPDDGYFFEIADAALAAMPVPFRPYVDGLAIVIEDTADADTLAEMGIEHPYDLTGLYQGRPLSDGDVGDAADALPNIVTLYRLPILIEWIETGERLDHLIRHVLIHEIGHHFGFSDADMHAIEAMADAG